MAEWREMPEFVGLDLEDSWVLGWRHDGAGQRLTFELEASVWPGHAAYEAPPPTEWTCYRPAVLAFEEVTSVVGLLDVAAARATVDPDGSRDYGAIEGLRHEGGVFRFSGEMGEVEVRAARVRLTLDQSSAPAR
jgi:hypothetical protein